MSALLMAPFVVDFMQSYMKAVKSKLQETHTERVEIFEKGAQEYAKKILANFKDYEFVSDADLVRPC